MEQFNKHQLRSKTVTEGKLMTGARALWRANGMKDEHFGKPVFAIVNSFSQFVPGHKHLHQIGQFVKNQIENMGYFAAEFNTIAIDDGIAMGHSGMFYSLPSRDLIADSIEYVCNAHCVDAMVCISNCDKITPGMLMAAMRLNIPAIFVSGGPMEAGNFSNKKIDLVDAIIAGASDSLSDEQLLGMERSACPTCGSCSGMFTANSMNCLTEAIGLALPGNGTLVATHEFRLKLFADAAQHIVRLAHEYYDLGNDSVLPRNIANKEAFRNAMAVDVAMGGSSNTILHILAIAHEAQVEFSLKDIDEISKTVPCICKVSPNSEYHIEDVHRAGGILSIMHELAEKSLINSDLKRVDGLTVLEAIEKFSLNSPEGISLYTCSPGNKFNYELGSQNKFYSELDNNRISGCIRSVDHAYYKEGGLAILFGNLAPDGCVIKTAGIDESLFTFKGKARVFESQETACDAILRKDVQPGDVVVIRYEGPAGGPGMQEMLYPTSYLKSVALGSKCALITDGRFSGGTSGLSIGHISPEAALGGNIALVKNGDEIEIDLIQDKINVNITETELAFRRDEELRRGDSAFTPYHRNRTVSTALKIYAMHVTSADKGAVRRCQR